MAKSITRNAMFGAAVISRATLLPTVSICWRPSGRAAVLLDGDSGFWDPLTRHWGCVGGDVSLARVLGRVRRERVSNRAFIGRAFTPIPGALSPLPGARHELEFI
jgi:hypothetical protein